MRISVLGKLLVVNLGAVAAATLLAGGGVVQVAWLIVSRGDMMATDHFPAFQRQTLLYLGVVSLFTFGLAGGAAWLLSRSLLRPLLRIKRATEAIADGNYSIRIQERTGDGIRSRERTGDELQELAADIDRMTESLDRVERLRRELVANVAHELRTPLTSAQGLLAAMRDGLLMANEQNLDAVAEETGRLIRLVEALHSLSVSDSAAIKGMERRPLDLAGLVAEIAGGMAPLFEQKQQTLQVATGSGPLWVTANRDALVQVLVNLLDNACKYAPSGAQVRVYTGASGGQARTTGASGGQARTTGAGGGEASVTVANTGSTIAPEDLPHVFERFYRGEKSRARATGGAGIGLAIVKNLTEAHGGRVTVTSDAAGTTFCVTIPANP